MAFNGFINEFTAAPLQTSYPSYLELDFTDTSDFTLEWSFQNQNTLYPFSNVIQAINTDGGDEIVLPNAMVTSAGTTTLIINTGTDAVLVYADDTTTLIATVETTQEWQLTLTDNTTTNGTWVALQLGSTTSSATAASLIDPTTDSNGHKNAGGLAAFGNYLKENILVNTFTAGALYTQNTGDRGAVLVWTSGTGTYQCLAANTLGDGFNFIIQNNSTGGIITVAPNATIGQTINGSATVFQLFPGESSLFVADGNETIYSYGSAQASTIATTVVDIDLAAVVGSLLLTNVQAAASIQEFVNAPGVVVTINYPAVNFPPNESIAYNTSTTNSIIVQINGEVNPLYQYTIPPLGRLSLFTDGTGEHLYNTPNFLINETFGISDGSPTVPSLFFLNSPDTGLFTPTSCAHKG